MNMVGLISMALLRTGARRASDQTDDLIHVCSLNYRQAGKRRLPAKGRTGGCTTGRLRRYLVLGARLGEGPGATPPCRSMAWSRNAWFRADSGRPRGP